MNETSGPLSLYLDDSLVDERVRLTGKLAVLRRFGVGVAKFSTEF